MRNCLCCGQLYDRHQEAEHCSKACCDALASLREFERAVDQVQDRCTLDAWKRLRSELMRLGNLRGWDREPGTQPPPKKARSSTPWPEGDCRFCGAPAPRKVGSSGRPPSICTDPGCLVLLEALRVAHSRLAGVAERSTLAGWRMIRTRLFLRANARAPNKGIPHPVPCDGSHKKPDENGDCQHCHRTIKLTSAKGLVWRHSKNAPPPVGNNPSQVISEGVVLVGTAKQEPANG